MRTTLPVLLLGAALAASAPAADVSLASTNNLTLLNTKAESVTFKGKKALRATISDEAARRLQAAARRRAGAKKATKKATKKAAPGARERTRLELLAIVDDIEFGDGTIELDLAGQPAPGATSGARGFVGVAWRLQEDNHTYDAFYLRPTNGRADDQERRNHSVQYMSHPDWPWFRLRSETPSKYETYADIALAEWIHVKIEVEGEKARLYVNHAEQPTLIVNDVKSGPNAKGKIALWLEGSTVAHYANLKITPK